MNKSPTSDDTEKFNSLIFYMLGAGASANALPIANEIRPRMFLFFIHLLIIDKEIEEDYIQDKGIDTLDFHKNQKSDYLHKLLLIIEQLEVKKSIDTYLHELYLTDNGKFEIYKSIYEMYMWWESCSDAETYEKCLKAISNNDNDIKNQLSRYMESHDFISDLHTSLKDKISKNISEFKKAEIDNRYYNFFIDLYTDNQALPKNINILTWNYDRQIEHALQRLKFNELDEYKVIDNKTPQFRRLNGRLTNIPENSSPETEDIKRIRDIFPRLMEKEISTSNEGNNSINGISFSFEEDAKKASNNVNVEGYLQEKLQSSNYNNISVIIIGYSFPFDNRFIDNAIVTTIFNRVFEYNHRTYKGDNKMSLNIYIQCPNPDDYKNSKERIESLLNNFIIHHNYVKYDDTDTDTTTAVKISMPKFQHISDIRDFYIPNTIGIDG